MAMRHERGIAPGGDTPRATSRTNHSRKAMVRIVTPCAGHLALPAMPGVE
jgi:hypothetical protein